MEMTSRDFLQPMLFLALSGVVAILSISFIGYHALSGELAKIFVPTLGVTLSALWIPTSGILVCNRLSR